jgi:hypothetical protein
MKNSTLTIILACILIVITIGSAIGICQTYRHGYEAGRQAAIESAKIVDIVGRIYGIDYDGETHIYEMSIEQIHTLVNWANDNAEMYKF